MNMFRIKAGAPTEGGTAVAALGIASLVLIAHATLLLAVDLDGCLGVRGTWPFLLWGAWMLALKALTRKRPLH